MRSDSELTLTVAATGDDHATVTMGGRLDVVEALDVRLLFAAEPLATTSNLVIDLGAVTFIDSAGLAVLARARRDRVRGGGSVVLIKPRSDNAMRVFQLTQFDQIFDMRDGADDGAH